MQQFQFLVLAACILLALPAMMDNGRKKVQIMNEEPQVDIYAPKLPQLFSR